MREGYRRLTKTIREGLLHQFLQEDNHRQDRSQIDTIICVEMMLIGFDLTTGISDATEAWAIIPGYDVFNYKSQHAEGVVGRLRILFGFYRAESRWLKDLEQYAQIDQNYRLFSLTENQEFSEGHVRYVPERKALYLKLLQNPIPHRQSEQTFSSPGDFFYERFEGQEKVRREGKLPDLNQSRLVFPLYRDKKELTCNFKSDWDGLVEELTIIAPQENWSQRFQALEILPLTEHQVFNYRGVNHIAGGLGTGKSTFRVLETYRLVQKHQAKVGMIEGSVAEVNKRVRELEQLGLKALPIIGTSNRKKHLKNYLAAASGSIVELSDWTQEERRTLSHLTGKCYVHALCSDYTTEHLPCNELYQGKKRVMCSMAQVCGVYEDFRRLLDADVWVTTSAAVLITRLPGMLDPYQRRIFEAMYDLLDVIFVDEADLVQEQFDSTFIEEYDLFGSPHHLFEELQIEVLAKVSGMTGMLVGYRYLPKEQDLGAFKFFEYSGVGRLLLQEWSHVYKAVDQLEGPGVVLLEHELVLNFSHVFYGRDHECMSIPGTEKKRAFSYVLRFSLINRGGQAERDLLRVHVGTRRFYTRVGPLLRETNALLNNAKATFLLNIHNPYVHNEGTPLTFSALKFKKSKVGSASYAQWTMPIKDLYTDILQTQIQVDDFLTDPIRWMKGDGRIRGYFVYNSKAYSHEPFVKAGLGLPERTALIELVKSTWNLDQYHLTKIPELSVTMKGKNQRLPVQSLNMKNITVEFWMNEKMFRTCLDILQTPSKQLEDQVLLIPTES